MHLSRQPSPNAFSLVEVVIALGICSVALMAIFGLFITGVQANRESREQIQAANLASMLMAMRQASPTNALGNFAIPAQAMTNAYANAFPGNLLTNYVGSDGLITNAANAAFLISCQAGTNAASGPDMAQVYMMLSWPASANPAQASAGHYELITYIPIR